MAFLINTCPILLLLLLAAPAHSAPTAPSSRKVSDPSAVLSDLYLSVGTLVPDFDPSVFYYSVALNSSISEVAVYVEAPPDQVSAGSGVSVNGTWVDSGSVSPLLELEDPGYTTTVYVYVLAIGYAPATYTVYVAREADEDESDSGSSSSGLSGLYIALIVIACVVVLALLAYALYWAFQHGYLDCIPGVAARGSPADYQSMP